MVVTCEKMAEAEAAFFTKDRSPELYMDEAGRKCAEAIRFFFPDPAHAEIFCGGGNNGGDSLVVARWLKRWGWHVEVHFSHGEEGLSPLGSRKWQEYLDEGMPVGKPRSRERILVDGLLGIGANGALRGAIRTMAEQLNEIRGREFATCFAIDIPTGLDGDSGERYEGAVVSDYTLSITATKTGFAAEQSIDAVGRLVEIPLDIPVSGDESIRFLFPSNLRGRLPRRSFHLHKGKAGRVSIFAGSRGTTGAAILTAMGASNSGAGLTTLFVEENIFSLVVPKCPAEVMVRPIQNDNDFLDFESDVLAIGPGLGTSPREALIDQIWTHPKPVVVDADGLNAAAIDSRSFSELPANRLLTPHPGELKRLTEQTADRVSITRKLADAWGVTLLHKGSRTAIATPGHPVELNTTGHPGMASGGMGDVLTGVCASLIGQGISTHDAASLGSWLIGRAAEIARDKSQIAASSVTAALMAKHLGSAMRDLESGGL